MGISGLLPLFKGSTTSCHISAFRGKRVAVDGYSWLHKSIFGCCIDLCLNKPTDKWIQYCLNLLDLLLNNGLLVVLVFDGCDLPAKRVTEDKRRITRAEVLKSGMNYLKSKDYKNARLHLSRAVNVSPRMAADFIKVVRAHRPTVDVIVAPFEADAQLAYLSSSGYVDSVISEDSDMIPYRCKEMIFKLDKDGSCQRLVLQHIYDRVPAAKNELDFRKFSKDMMLSMCVAAGCDYLPSVKGFGLKNSYKYTLKHNDPVKVLAAMRLAGLMPLEYAAVKTSSTGNPQPQSSHRMLTYELEFHKALLTFKHQTVFDPIEKKVISLQTLHKHQLPECFESMSVDLSFLGEFMPDAIAIGIAAGTLDPVTHVPFFETPECMDRPIAMCSSVGAASGSASTSAKGKAAAHTATGDASYYTHGKRLDSDQDGIAQAAPPAPSRQSFGLSANKPMAKAANSIGNYFNSTTVSSTSTISGSSIRPITPVFSSKKGFTSNIVPSSTESSLTKLKTANQKEASRRMSFFGNTSTSSSLKSSRSIFSAFRSTNASSALDDSTKDACDVVAVNCPGSDIDIDGYDASLSPPKKTTCLFSSMDANKANANGGAAQGTRASDVPASASLSCVNTNHLPLTAAKPKAGGAKLTDYTTPPLHSKYFNCNKDSNPVLTTKKSTAIIGMDRFISCKAKPLNSTSDNEISVFGKAKTELPLRDNWAPVVSQDPCHFPVYISDDDVFGVDDRVVYEIDDSSNDTLCGTMDASIVPCDVAGSESAPEVDPSTHSRLAVAFPEVASTSPTAYDMDVVPSDADAVAEGDRQSCGGQSEPRRSPRKRSASIGMSSYSRKPAPDNVFNKFSCR